MKEQPQYFEVIRQKAETRWNQLEGDPELAGPWHQLFEQVQSPRHILSELLQNADDAKATQASVRLEEDRFIFQHNGEDFSEDHFGSLCRFGFSNKSALHTIGFRGIGFKSTFSLGKRVALRTPTLAVEFRKERFTEPVWTDALDPDLGSTEISVAIDDPHKRMEIEDNLAEWLESPVSLLFFKHVRMLRIGDAEIHWQSVGPGPVQGSEWMSLTETGEEIFLHVVSEPQPFPDEALNEIRQQRRVKDEGNATFPPSRVELVIGVPGRLHVVLPTGVQTELPFACNAPFIQDPARVEIKSPATSPTNRWLLERIGTLAARTILEWVANESLPLEERAQAYSALPDADRTDKTLAGVCAAAVELECDDVLDEHPFILTETGTLAARQGALLVDTELLDVWPAEQLSALLDSNCKPIVSRYISDEAAEALRNWSLVTEVGRETVANTLRARTLPRPESWAGLMALWAYLAPEITPYVKRRDATSIRILPVQGKSEMYSAAEAVRLGESKLLNSSVDWEFLDRFLLVLNPNWPRFLAEQRRIAEREGQASDELNAATDIMAVLGLDKAADASAMAGKVVQSFSQLVDQPIADHVRLAQILAKLDVSVAEKLAFVTADEATHASTDGLVFDPKGRLVDLLPTSWTASHMLHEAYAEYSSCSEAEWDRWVDSGRAGVHRLPPLASPRLRYWSSTQFQKALRARGYSSPPAYPYQSARPYSSQYYELADHDFPKELVEYWKTSRSDDVWQVLTNELLAAPSAYWRGREYVSCRQSSTNGNSVGKVGTHPIAASWLQRLRTIPCLRSTTGGYAVPSELLRRTPVTEALLGVEPFVEAELDIESNRPLLDLMGVRSEPTNAASILVAIRALTLAPVTPVMEVEKWYYRLDQLTAGLPLAEIEQLRAAFIDERLVFTQDGDWVDSRSVFIGSDEEAVPGVPLIRHSVRDLALWRRLHIAERPTADRVIDWMKTIPAETVLGPEQARRVRLLLSLHARRVWEECGHWLNLSRQWVPTSQLKYVLTMQSLVETSTLHEWVKQATADLKLAADITESDPFASIPRLASVVEERLNDSNVTASVEVAPWMTVFASELRRVRLDSDDETQRVRALAERLLRTTIHFSNRVEVVPYVAGVPAGTSRTVSAVWAAEALFVVRASQSRMARDIPETLGKVFIRPDIAAALSYCIGRPLEQVTEYLRVNFDLAPAEEEEGASSHPASALLVDDSARARIRSIGDNEQLSKLEPTLDVGSLTALEAFPDAGLPGADTEPSDERELRHREESTVNSPKQLDTNEKARQRVSLIQRFASSKGYRRESESCFVHQDGRRLVKESCGGFDWTCQNKSGHVLWHYCIRDNPLSVKPLNLEADLWSLLRGAPARYALIVSDLDGSPLVFTGQALAEMLESGELKLYPASYRLVMYEHNANSLDSSTRLYDPQEQL